MKKLLSSLLLLSLSPSLLLGTPNPSTSQIKLIALDVDGVLTDGSFTYNPQGKKQVRFHVHDLLGMILAQKAGIELALITGAECETTDGIVKRLQLNHFYPKRKNKLEALKELSEASGYSFNEIAFMGDDIIDEDCMRTAGFTIAPPNAVDSIKNIANLVTERKGGQGAVREAIEYILSTQGKLNNPYAQTTAK